MATQSFIMIAAADISDAADRVTQTKEAYLQEVARDQTGKGYPENNAVWGATYGNVIELRNACDRMIRAMQAEFGN